MASPRSVLLLGATGLVGGECLRLLQASDAFGRIVVLTRRPLESGCAGEKVEQHIINFDHLTGAAGLFEVDQIICALGTTMRQAGSRRAFRTVDLIYPLTAAHLGAEKKVSHFLLVSAQGADARSPIFYNRVKGELENDVSSLRYRSLTIARPSILTGKREQPRTFERIAAGFAFLAPEKVKPVRASEVAAALIHQAMLDEPGRIVLDSAQLRRIAKSAASERLGTSTLQAGDAGVVETSVA
jgi:uncharacterized protein YbjT (DUF2867 family)